MDNVLFFATIDGVSAQLPDEDTRDDLAAAIRYTLREGGGFVTVPLMGADEALHSQVLISQGTKVTFHQSLATPSSPTALGF